MPCGHISIAFRRPAPSRHSAVVDCCRSDTCKRKAFAQHRACAENLKVCVLFELCADKDEGSIRNAWETPGEFGSVVIDEDHGGTEVPLFRTDLPTMRQSCA